jgi:hypothetical protein
MPLTPQQKTRLEIWKKHPAIHHKLISTFARKFNADPVFQYKLHVIGTQVFLAQIPFAVACAVFLPHVWATAGLIYVTVISLMANAQTEYGSVSAAEAAVHSEAAHESISTQVRTDYTAVEKDIAKLANLQPGPDGTKLAREIVAHLTDG